MTMANKTGGGTPVGPKEASSARHNSKAAVGQIQGAGAVCGGEDVVPRDSGGVSCFACRRSKKLCSKEVPCSRCRRLGVECVPQPRRPGRPPGAFTGIAVYRAATALADIAKLTQERNQSSLTPATSSCTSSPPRISDAEPPSASEAHLPHKKRKTPS